MRALKIILKILLAVVILSALAVSIAIQSPRVQTRIADTFISTLEDNLNGDVQLGSIQIKPFNTLIVRDLVIIDPEPVFAESSDTLAWISDLTVRFRLTDLIRRDHEDIKLKSVKIRGGGFNLVVERGKYASNISRILNLKSSGKTLPDGHLLTIDRIYAEGVSYTMLIPYIGGRNIPETAIDWSDVDVRDMTLNAKNFTLNNQLFDVDVTSFSAREKSGWTIKDLSAHAQVGRAKAYITNIVLHDDDSELRFDYAMIGNIKAYSNYIDKVRMILDVKSSHISMRSLARFIPPMNPDPYTFVSVTGHVDGPVSDMHGTRMHFQFEDSSISGDMQGSVSRLPDWRNMDLNATLDNAAFTTQDVCRLVNTIAPKAGLDLKNIGKDSRYTGKASVAGNINDLNIQLDLKQNNSDGTFAGKVKLSNVLRYSIAPIRINGKIASNELKLMPLVGVDAVESLTARSEVSVTLPFKGTPIDARLDSLHIRNIDFKEHTYERIDGNVALQGEDITCDLKISDSALDADVTVWSEKYAYNGSAVINKADLHELHFDKRELSNLSMEVYGRLEKDFDALTANGNISNINMTNAEGTQYVENVAVRVEPSGNGYEIDLNSVAANAYFKGDKKAFVADFESYDTNPFLSFILPGLYMEEGTKAHAMLRENGDFDARVTSGRVALNRSYIKNFDAVIDGKLDNLRANITSENIILGGLNFDSNVINATLVDSLLTVGYTFENREGRFNNGDINFSIGYDGESYTADINPSHFNLNNNRWEIPTSSIGFSGKEINVRNFILRSGDQLIKLNGNISEKNNELFTAVIQNLDIETANEFFVNKNLGIGGIVNATGKIISPIVNNTPELDIDLKADNVRFGGEDLGTIYIVSRYDRTFQHFNAYIDEKIGDRKTLSANMIYEPDDKNIEATAMADHMPFGFAQVFIPFVFSEMEGSVSGRFNLDGPTSKLSISSKDARIDNGMLRVAYTDVPYYISGTFHVNDSGIHLDDIDAHDRFNSKAIASGSLHWENMRNLDLDVNFKCNNIEALDLSLNESSPYFYGHIFGSGDVSFKGPFRFLVMDANVENTANSTISFVVPNNYEASQSNLLEFVKPGKVKIDPYELMIEQYRNRRAKKASNFTMKLHTVANPQLKVNFDMGDLQFAAGVQGTGNGDLDLIYTSNPSRFTIFGEYDIAEGIFSANTGNIVKRNFNIISGSQIMFEGGIADTRVNLDATYETKAPITTLIADETSVSKRRQVLCGINLQDKLMKPQIKFSIDIPDLNPSVKSRVESALSTEDKVQKQVLSLLVSNNFLPDEQSGIVNNSSLIYSNVSEIMANQINNIFTKLDIPLDLGLNYQPTDRGNNLFDVAVSTQLFNNRVLIGGNFGNRENATSTTTSFFGDLDVQYKVTENGAFRINLFSHAADQYSNYLDNLQRNGVGITWQQEFNSFKTWLSELFMSRKKKQQAEAMKATEEKKNKTVILDE